MGKGDRRRRCCTSREEEEIRYALARKEITLAEFKKQYKILEKGGKIWRH